MYFYRSSDRVPGSAHRRAGDTESTLNGLTRMLPCHYISTPDLRFVHFVRPRFCCDAAPGTVSYGASAHARRWSSHQIYCRDSALITALLGLEIGLFTLISISLRLVGFPTAVSRVIGPREGPDYCPRTIQKETNSSTRSVPTHLHLIYFPSSTDDIVTVNND